MGEQSEYEAKENAAAHDIMRLVDGRKYKKRWTERR